MMAFLYQKGIKIVSNSDLVPSMENIFKNYGAMQ